MGIHAIEHELSALYDVAHGAGLAVIFPAWMSYVCQHNIPRFVQFAVRVWNVEQDFLNPERTARMGIEKTKEFFASIGLPVTLEQLGIKDDRLEEMADRCTNEGTLTRGSLVKLGKSDIIEIYKLSRE